VRAAALNVTFDVARGMVVFVLPIRDLTAAVGGLTLGRVFTRVSARSADAYPGHVVAVDSTPNGAWRAGDNRCFGQR
jgi:hypothetical protein